MIEKVLGMAVVLLLVGEVTPFHISSRLSKCLHCSSPLKANTPKVILSSSSSSMYDDWRSDVPVDTMPLEEEFVQIVLDEMVYSNDGEQMFGVHDRAASIGITGEISLAEVDGPEVYLSLSGKFWHTRSFILGRAAVYLNARIPEIMRVSVLDTDELNDFEEVIDEDTGDIIEVVDRRSPDYNGDRETMIYQGIDPDMRGPFPVTGGGGDFKIIPA